MRKLSYGFGVGFSKKIKGISTPNPPPTPTQLNTSGATTLYPFEVEGLSERMIALDEQLTELENV